MTDKENAIQCIKDEAQAVLDLIPKIDDNFDKAVDMILHCTGKVIVTGVGKSGHIGAKIAATLASTGTPSFFINPLDVFHGDLGVMSKGDVVLAISNSGQTDELLRFIPMVLHMEIPIIAMSGNPMSLLAKYSTCHLNVSVEKEACPLNLAPTSSTTATLVMGDALAIALMKKRHFQPQDFAQFHPGGELGKRLLTTAQDVMITENLPILAPEMNLGEAAMEQWKADFFNRCVKDIMTKTPKTVSPQTKISEIQKIMNKNKIHNVLVSDSDNKLLGIVDRYACIL